MQSDKAATNAAAATLADVARLAGVSANAASVVLNGARSNTRVSEETRRRVRDAAVALRYHPNLAARGLARRRTHTLGAFFALDTTKVLADPYPAALLQGVTACAAAVGYDVLLYTRPWHDAARSAAQFRDGRSDGLILIAPPLGSDILPALAALGVPCVTVAAGPDDAADAGVPLVDVDNASGVRLAVGHLARLGHRRIAHVTGDQDVASAPQRRDAFLSAMAGAGLPVPAAYVAPAHYSSAGAAEALRALLALPEPPTAVLAGNDNIAFALLDAARECGVEAPGRLSVVGFDDAPAAAQVTPRLTTVRQPLGALAAAAVELLTARLQPQGGAGGKAGGGAAEPTQRLFAPEIVLRGSTAPPPPPA